MYVNVFSSNSKTNNVQVSLLLYMSTVQTSHYIIIYISIPLCVVNLGLFYILLQIHCMERFRGSELVLYNNTCFKLYATIAVSNINGFNTTNYMIYTIINVHNKNYVY